jgi:hypothetical protein
MKPLTVAQLADRWQCSSESIYALIRKFERGEPGGLKHFKIGPKLIRIPCQEVDGKTLVDFHVEREPARGSRLARKILNAIGPLDERSGSYVYFIKSGKYVKIGFTASDPKWRAHDFKIGNPDIKLLGHTAGTRATERMLHNLFREWHHRNEWFRLDAKVLNAIRDLCNA